MGLRFFLFIFLVGICAYLFWKLQQKYKIPEPHLIVKEAELQEKGLELQENHKLFKKELERLKKDKNTLEAKYLKKLTAADVKKNNLYRYRRKV
ncbi:MAG: hypothetical protein ACTSPD_21885 [Promethearchaeota archaeon]